MDDEVLREVVVPGKSRIVLMVLDGLGGLPHPETRRSELQTAMIPHLDRLAADSACGLTIPVERGVTPGSGPGHLALFGYDPIANNIGRGVLEAVGIDFPLGPSDVAARGNFCTVDDQGVITDRRAGRISTEKCGEMCNLLREVELPGVQVLIEPVREHRFVLVLRGEGLSDDLAPLGTDPQREGLRPVAVEARSAGAAATAKLYNSWIAKAARILAGQRPANFSLLRGFAKYPQLPSMSQRFGLKAAAVALYPMYRGLAKLAGMQALESGQSFEDEVATVATHWDEYDFFFVHYKKTDSAGEDGDFLRKVHALEEFDAQLPKILELKPDVLMIAGDHSTPAIMAAHSWHPVPFMLHSNLVRADETDAFNELACQKGQFFEIYAREVMQIAMAHAGRFTKFGA
jgi:2,3-bisphosphoglycerate-independent phosphoglycerate mutase